MCADNDGYLTGMEAFVGRFSTASDRLLSTLAMNNIGDVSGVCKTLQVDPTKGEYINTITVRYGSEFIDAISIGSNTGARVFTGNFPSEYTDSVMTFTESQPLVGFFGTAGAKTIYSVGQVVVDTSCTVQADPNVTPIENINPPSDSLAQWNQATGLDTTSTIYVAAATTFVVVSIIGTAIGGAIYYKKKSREAA